MNIFYSPSNNSFYDERLKSIYKDSSSGWPNDVVLLSDDEKNKYFCIDPPEGYELGNSGGRPIWVEKGEDVLSPDQIRDLAWLSQRYQVREGLIITVRPPQTGKHDDAVLRGFLFGLQNGLVSEVMVTDIDGIKQPMNEQEVIAAIADGIRQTEENYNIWYETVTKQ